MSFFHALLSIPGEEEGLQSDFIPVIFDDGQSNSIGRGEADRLALTIYPDASSDIYIYFKPSYASTDNGNFQPILAGSNTVEFDQAIRTYGSYYIFAIKLRDLLNRPVYVVATGDGGTAYKQNLTTPDASPLSTGECFDTAHIYYLQTALGKLVTANPGKQIVVFPSMCRGETDAFVVNDPATTEFAANFAAHMAAKRNRFATILGLYPDVVFAPITHVLLHYLETANETTVNNAITSYVASNPTSNTIMNVSDLKQKNDLTTDEKGGFSATTGADDEHLSYLAHNAIGIRKFDYYKSHYALTGDDSEITSNTEFNPATITPNGIRVQLSRDNVNIGASNIITGVTNSLTGPALTVTGNLRFKTDKRKGAAFFQQATPNAFIQTATPIGTSFFSNSFSWGAWIKPRDGNPPALYYIFHDIASTGSPNNSRCFFALQSDGTLNAAYAQGGVAVQGITNTPVFTDTQRIDQVFVAATFTSGGLIRIYTGIKGQAPVLQTLNAVNNGDISGRTMASYVNNTNVFTMGAQRSGASTYANFLFGMGREFIVETGVVWSAADITNLMLL